MPKVMNKKPRVMFFNIGEGQADIQLNPGLNVVPDELWAKVHEIRMLVKDPSNPHRKVPKKYLDILVEEDEIEVLKEPGGGGSSFSFDALSESEAIQLSRKTFHLPTLEAFKVNEKRPAVRDALQAQIDEINRPPSDDEKKAREIEPEGPSTPRVETDETEDEDGNDLKVTMPKPAVRRPFKKGH